LIERHDQEKKRERGRGVGPGESVEKECAEWRGGGDKKREGGL
jgi:hypothetical protein